MLKNKRIAGLTLLLILTLLLAGVSCGTPVNEWKVLQGHGNLPGAAYRPGGATGDAIGGGGSIPQAGSGEQPIVGGSHSAPLGVNPLYNVNLGGAVITPIHSSSRTTSALGPGQLFKLNRITLARKGDLPDWTATSFIFREGDTIDFYADYEVAAGVEFTRKWTMDSAKLSYAEPMTSHAQTGRYLAMFRYTLPIGSANQNAMFDFDVYYGNRTTSSAHKHTSRCDCEEEARLADKAFSVAVGVDAGGGAGGVNTYESQTGVYNFSGANRGFWCGHIDVDTSSRVYPPNSGSTDGHIHEFDNKFDTTTINYFDMKTTTLHNIQRDVPADQKFKIILANADLSPGGRLVINKTYNENDPSTYIRVTDYDDIPLNELPVYSLSGLPGTIKLEKFEMQFLTDAIFNRMVHPTNTGDARGNKLGPNGETRNGALTIQAVKVNANGTDAFTTSQTYSNGGVQGAALSGLAWESFTFWHWGGPSYHQSGWATYDYTKDLDCDVEFAEPTVLASGGGNFRIMPLSGLTQNFYPQNGTARMFWEDLLSATDNDYNEFVGDLAVSELRTGTGALKQVMLYVKARARGATDNTKVWQFNMDGLFPGANVQATVDQFYDNADADLGNDAPHVYQAVWNSQGGLNVPVFVNTREALPKPANSSATTNTVKDTTYVEGDYALVTITFQEPVAAGTFTPAPYSPELRVQQSNSSVYVYHLWRRKGDARLPNGYPQGGFIIPATPAWTMESKSIASIYPGFDAWTRWLGTPNTDDPRDPNSYLGLPPTTGGSIIGSPQTTTYWISSAGQNEFHTAGSGQLPTLDLLKYLNGDPALTNSSRSREVLRPLQAPQSYFSKAPLRLTKATSNPSDGYNDVKAYMKDGVSTSKPLDWQLGARLVALVLNVERGRLQPNEWVWIPELNEIRPLVSDARMPGVKGVIAETNAVWGLPASAANDAKKVLWRDICARINANTYIVQEQYWPEPTPRWWEHEPTGTDHFLRSRFK